MKKKRYTKNMLVRELAFSTGITQKTARFVLEALRHIAYRETADQGFTLPGLCRMDIIRRKARRMRNPQTGENILIGEHDALRVRALKKARDAITPQPKDLITTLPPEPSETAPQSKILDDFSNAVSFCCKKCGQEIEAPLAAAGMRAECPVCKEPVTIPNESEPGTLHGPALPEEPEPTPAPAPAPAPAPTPTSAPVPDTGAALPTPAAASANEPAAPEPPLPAIDHAKLKNQTIRIDLGALGFDTTGTPQPQKAPPRKRMISFFCKNCRQEIEAPAEMAGSASECPSCGVSFEVPFFSDPGTLHGSDLETKRDAASIKEMKSRTIRIEVPDDF